MDQGNIMIAVLAWLGWIIHLMACHKVREWPSYILYVWRVGLVTLPILGCIAVSRPTELLSTYMILVFAAMIGMWAGTGVVSWCNVLDGDREHVCGWYRRVYSTMYSDTNHPVTDLENPTPATPQYVL